MVLELAERGSLFDQVVERGAMSEKQAQTYFKQIVSALLYLKSKNLCHRDLKLENILVSSDDNIKLADFGVTCDIDQIDYTER